MTYRTHILSAAVLAAALTVGCSHDKDKMQDDPTMSSSPSAGGTNKPLEGNPGATTNQAAGYPQSDPGVYHPQTDDTHQYHPAPSGTIQPDNH